MRPAAFSSSPKLPELYEKDPYCISFSARPRPREPRCPATRLAHRRTIGPGPGYCLLGEWRQGFRSMDAPPCLRDGRPAPRGPLRGRSAPHPVWKQSYFSGRHIGRSRHGRGGAQPQGRAALRPNRKRTKRDRDRPLLRDEATGIELGQSKSPFPVCEGFAARFAQRAIVRPDAEKRPNALHRVGNGSTGASPCDRSTPHSRTTSAPASRLDALGPLPTAQSVAPDILLRRGGANVKR